ncbi:PrkA family serine protein kinase [Patescibacteria group bacterium]
MGKTVSLCDMFKGDYDNGLSKEMTVSEYFEEAKSNKDVYASPQGRLLKAIGKPNIIDTSQDEKLGRIFQNRTIKTYETFRDFFGVESSIEAIVSFLTQADQGLDAARKILYLLGPVGGGKSSIAERLKDLMEKVSFYALKDSPIFESPLALFSEQAHRRILTDNYGISSGRIPITMSPWLAKRLKECEGDISKFKVVKIHPSKLRRVGISVVMAGDENTQDISVFVGKNDINKLEEYSEGDPDAYLPGALGIACNGLIETKEIFKASPKTIHPLLTATSDRTFEPTEGISSMPFEGLILAHSNESEWKKFKDNKCNEAFVSRTFLIKVPYTLRVSEEELIYKKLIANSSLSSSPSVPGTIEMLSNFSVLTRLTPPSENPKPADWKAKTAVYDGDRVKDNDVKVRPIQVYLDMAGVNEGMAGFDTRMAFDVLGKVFNYHPGEVAAHPVYLLTVLENEIRQMQDAREEEYLGTFLNGILREDYKEFLGNEIRSAFLESYDDYGQNVFDRYMSYVISWIKNEDFKDPQTGVLLKKVDLDRELEKIEKPANIGNPKSFRNEIFIHLVERFKDKDFHWTSYEKIKEVIEKKIFTKTDELLPVISFGPKGSEEEEKKHKDFVDRMIGKGYYNSRLVKLAVDWYVSTLNVS